jgi:hypothetical protein
MYVFGRYAVMTKTDIINLAIQLANKEIDRSTRNQNLMQVVEMKRFIRRLLQLRDEILI